MAGVIFDFFKSISNSSVYTYVDLDVHIYYVDITNINNNEDKFQYILDI